MAEKKLDRWKSLITDWQESGETREVFCRERDLKISTFSYWRTKINKHNKLGNTGTGAPLKDSFIRYSLPSSVSNGFTIEWPDGMKLRLPSGISLQEIAELLGALKGHR